MTNREPGPAIRGRPAEPLRYRLEVRLSAADAGRRVEIRWRWPAADGGAEIADVAGVLEAAELGSP
ncbi:MAG: hypothetical protein ACRDOK_28890 [Streptosporangiaceae bacterium]